MANPTLATLRATVRGRLRLSANDPAFPDQHINRAISMAANDIGNANPNGWWFQQYELTFQNAGAFPDLVPVVMSDRQRTVEKVVYVYASLNGDYWEPITQRERTDAVRAAGGRMAAAGLPLSWGVTRRSYVAAQRAQIALVFDPPLPTGAWLRVGVIIGPDEFAADTDRLANLMAPFAGVVVEKACAILARKQRRVGARRYIPTHNSVATTAAQEWTHALRLWFATPYSGPGFPTLRRRS